MIKSLLGSDEPTEKEKIKSDEDADTSLTAPFQKPESIDTPAVTDSETVKLKANEQHDSQKVEPFEITDPIGKPKLLDDVDMVVEDQQTIFDKDLLGLDDPNNAEQLKPAFIDSDQPGSGDKSAKDVEKIHILPKTFTPDTVDETIRKSGLAWSAAIVLFASVAFMMLFGWFADFMFGTSPWGIVVGIVVGAVIGFVQFFRTTAQILRPPKSQINKIPIYTRANDDKTD